MTISEHVEEFAGLPVREYDPKDGIADPTGIAYRLSLEYDSKVTFANLLGTFLDDARSSSVVALVVGSWGPDLGGGNGSEQAVADLVAARDRLPNLKSLFLGDITYDECEISWLHQSDVTPLLTAYPALEQLRVRGGEDLVLSDVRHEGLRALTIETGGLPASVVRSIGTIDLPNLEHLELWLGSENYGGNTTVDDLAPILAGDRFPRLKYLGLRDAEIADEVAAALADAPVLGMIETLDLSLGILGDEGAVALLSGGNLAGLKKLDIHHHYVSAEVLDGLKALGIELDDSDGQELAKNDDGSDDRYIAVSE